MRTNKKNVCLFTFCHLFKERRGAETWINWLRPRCSSQIETSWYPLYAHSCLHVQGAHSWRVCAWYVCRRCMCAPLLCVCVCIYLKVHFWAPGVEGGVVAWKRPDRRPLCKLHQGCGPGSLLYASRLSQSSCSAALLHIKISKPGVGLQ